MTANVPLVVRLLASSVSVANRAGKIVRDVMSKGELGIVEKVRCMVHVTQTAIKTTFTFTEVRRK